MKASRQFQKQPASSATPISQTSKRLQARPFRDPNASTTTQPSQSSLPTTDYDPSDRPAWCDRLTFNPQRPSMVQAKLTVGAPNDVYEQEADQVAEQVMSMPDRPTQQPIQRETAPEDEELQTKPIAASITPLVQRETIPEEEEALQTKASPTPHSLFPTPSIQREAMPEEDELQTKSSENPDIQREDNLEEEEIQTKPLAGTLQREEVPEEEDLQMKSLGNSSIQREDILEEEEIQTKPSLQRATNGSFQADSSIDRQINSSKGGGSPLPQDVEGFMESRFRTDFSQVRVHTDSEAVQMNRDLNAQAFTHKQDIYFGAGKTPAKDALTAHELTHVVQQAAKVQPVLSPMIQRQKKKKKKAKATGISINHSVTLFPQPTNMTCWSAAATMILGDRSVDSGGVPTDAAYGLKITDANVETFAQAYGFTMHYPQTWTVNGLAELLRSRPLWIGGNMPGLHAVVIGSMSGDGSVENTSITIYNPWPPGVGKVETLSYGAWINQFPMATMYVLHQ